MGREIGDTFEAFRLPQLKFLATLKNLTHNAMQYKYLQPQLLQLPPSAVARKTFATMRRRHRRRCPRKNLLQ